MSRVRSRSILGRSSIDNRNALIDAAWNNDQDEALRLIDQVDIDVNSQDGVSKPLLLLLFYTYLYLKSLERQRL